MTPAGGRPGSRVWEDVHPQLEKLAVLAFVAGCRHPIDDAKDKPPTPTAPTQIVSTPASSSPVFDDEVVPDDVGGCERPVRVRPEVLTGAIPTWIGKCVRLPARIVRSLDLTRVVVRAGPRNFVVWLSPGREWTGTRVRSFVVMGTTTVPLGGRAALPELLLADGAGPE